MGATWLVCAGPAERNEVEALVRRLDPGSQTVRSCDPALMRSLVAGLDPAPCVAVGAGLPVEPVNVAAAVASDGRAARVVLALRGASGSLVSRAAKAGVTEVIDPREGVEPASPGCGAEGGLERWSSEAPAMPRAADGLDEPDCVSGAAAETRSGAAAVRERALSLPAGHAPLICVASGRGGVGKSSVASLMALVCARWGLKVALVDLDLTFGNLFGFFGLPGPADLTAVSEGVTPEALDRCGVRVAENLTLYGPCERPEYAEAVAPRTAELLGALCDRFDLVVADTSSAWGDEVAAAAQGADRLVIVGDERAGAIGSLARAAALAVRLGVARTRLVRLMNRCDAKRRDEEFMTRASMGLEGARSFRTLEGSLDVAELLSAGHAPELAGLDNDFATSCAAVAAKLLSDLGCLPDCDEARRARDAKVVRRRSVFSFAKAAG
ncbi:P-loop NTPase [Atopobiaceae bacterium 24-176]